MSMQDMRDEIAAAERTLRNADLLSQQFATLLQGRMRHVHTWTLKDLKRELRDFNMHTGKWKNQE